MWGLEMYHEIQVTPDKPMNRTLFRFQPQNIPQLSTNPILAWMSNNIGDIWEISVGFVAFRVLFAIGNELLIKWPRVKGWQFSDKASFWISLGTILLIKATHSLGYYSLFGINDHMGNPVPGMLFGQGVAAVVLIGAHYLGTYIASHIASIKDFEDLLIRFYKKSGLIR